MDGLLALGCGGNVQLLAGLRYDYFTTKFTDPTVGILTLTNDTADIRSEGWIPLFGYSMLRQAGTAIAVPHRGRPDLLGQYAIDKCFQCDQSLRARGTTTVVISSKPSLSTAGIGRYGNIGVFGRYNVTGGHSVFTLDELIAGTTVVSRDFGLA